MHLKHVLLCSRCASLTASTAISREITGVLVRSNMYFAFLLIWCAVGASPALALIAEDLRDGWQVGSSCKAPLSGKIVSAQGFRAEGWYTASVPATVLAVQLANHAFAEDIFYGTNLRNLPGMTYAVGTFFSNQDMPANSPYACGWWYRHAFHAVAAPGERTWLHFGGVNYRANIWVNGTLVADSTKIAGAYRIYDLDITDCLNKHGDNVVAAETFAPNANDLGINWVDWNPCPPDKDMGLWGSVSLKATRAVTLRSPLVTTHFLDPSLGEADLSVTVELSNSEDTPISGVLKEEIDGLSKTISIEKSILLAAHEERSITLTPEEFPQLRVKDPPVWWPVDWGGHPLENLHIAFTLGAKLSDTTAIRFGIREVSSELDKANHLLFRVNRKPILIRGGGWSPDMLLRVSDERMRQEFYLADDLHLNTIRLEGKLETDEFFNLADEHGVLVMAGWCCCDHWEHWTKWTTQDKVIATASLRSQLLRIRHHASMLVWLNGSDGPPPEEIERAYLAVEKEVRWPDAILSSAAATPTLPTGPSGVKMLGPYDYVVPSYWLRDTEKAGGAYGFNTETSPGPAIPSIAELERFLPASQLWPINATWAFHTGGGKYKSLSVINTAMSHIYGPADDLITYTRTAQAMAYDSERAMFEAYARNKYESTGVVQWMLNNAWPSLIWHLYDYYLQPGAGYYGTKKACEPLHVQYSYDDKSIVVVNSTQVERGPLAVHAQVYDFQSRLVYDRSTTLDAKPDSTNKTFVIPDKAIHSAPLAFLQLELRSGNGAIVSRNFYWLPSSETLFDWPNTDYTHTPAATYEDLSALHSLPLASLKAELVPLASSAGHGTFRVRIKNTSSALAFQLSVEALTAAGKPYTPLLWSDDFISLLPGEERELSARTIDEQPSADGDPVLHLSAWNVKDMIIPNNVQAAR